MSAKSYRFEIITGLIVTIVGGIIVSTYEIFFSDDKEPVAKVKSAKPKPFYYDLKEFYTLSDYDVEDIEDRDSSTWQWSFGVKMGGFYLTSFFNRQSGIKKNIYARNDEYSCNKYDMKSIAYVSGIPVFNPKIKQHLQIKENIYDGGINDGFTYYNPTLIKWATRYLIPKPKDKNSQGITFQKIYDELYKNNVRFFAKNYLYFKDEKTYKNAQLHYKISMKTKEFNGPEYLYKYYSYENDHVNMGGLYTPIAIGFWIRRGIDGTNDELWQCFVKILKLYDHDWFKANIAADNDLWGHKSY